MRLVVTALIFLTGLFDLFMAVSFLLDPGSAGAGLGVAAIGMAGGPQGAAAGLSTIRADFTSFFGVGAFCMMWGAWRRNADLLLVPALLFGVSFVGRAVNVAMVGPIRNGRCRWAWRPSTSLWRLRRGDCCRTTGSATSPLRSRPGAF
jgi:hypothetical protein